MAHCPVCAASVSDDFGLIECPSCGVQLIVHMDGRVESQAAAVSEFSSSAGVEPSDSRDASHEFDAEEEPVEKLEELPDEMPASGPAEDLFFGEEPPEQSPVEEDPAVDLASPESEFAGEAPETIVPAAPELSDIERFANSDSVSIRDGSLRYNLWIVGIDTADVREAFREALTDRKFMWDTDQILKSIRDGEVQIENVTASKAHILVSRLRSMPVQVRWEQYVVQQS